MSMFAEIMLAVLLGIVSGVFTGLGNVNSYVKSSCMTKALQKIV